MKKRAFLTLFYFTLIVIPNFSQVLIGGDEKPAEGSILQLKNIKGSTDGTTADKGLALPRVNLSEPDKLFPMYSYADDENTPTEEDMDRHTGLVVYNTNETELMCHGIYVWKKNKWQGIGTGIKDFLVDKRTKPDGTVEENTYPIRDFGAAGVWMVSNLRATTYADNIPAKMTSDLVLSKNPSSELDMKSYYYPLGGINGATEAEDRQRYLENPHWGMMYSWTAVTNGEKHSLSKNEGEGFAMNTNVTISIVNPTPANVEQVGIQGICPEGWHVPSDKEMNDLEKEIANDQNAKYYSGEPVNGLPYRPQPWNDDWRYNLGGQVSSRGTHSLAMISSYTNDEFFPKTKYVGQARRNCDGAGGFATYQLGYLSPGQPVAGPGKLGDYWTSSMATTDETNTPSDILRVRGWYRSIYVQGFEEVTTQLPAVHRNIQTATLYMSVRCKKN